MWDNTKRTNTHVTVVPKREQKKTCEGTMSENFPNLALAVNLQIQKSQWIPSRKNIKKSMLEQSHYGQTTEYQTKGKLWK